MLIWPNSLIHHNLSNKQVFLPPASLLPSTEWSHSADVFSLILIVVMRKVPQYTATRDARGLIWRYVFSLYYILLSWRIKIAALFISERFLDELRVDSSLINIPGHQYIFRSIELWSQTKCTYSINLLSKDKRILYLPKWTLFSYENEMISRYELQPHISCRLICIKPWPCQDNKPNFRAYVIGRAISLACSSIFFYLFYSFA